MRESGGVAMMTENLFGEAKPREGYGREWHIGPLKNGWWLADGIPYDENGECLPDSKPRYDYCLVVGFKTKVEAEYWQLKLNLGPGAGREGLQ